MACMLIMCSCMPHRLMIGANGQRKYALHRLICAAHVPLTALKHGYEHYLIIGQCSFGMVHYSVLALLDGKHDLSSHADVILGIFVDSLLHPAPAQNPLVPMLDEIRSILRLLQNHNIRLIATAAIWPCRCALLPATGCLQGLACIKCCLLWCEQCLKWLSKAINSVFNPLSLYMA